jgi:PAS domain S-box
MLTMSPIRDDTGSIIAIATISRDITDLNRLREELRIKQEKLHEIIEFLPDPTFIVDRNKTILGWNRALEDFTGIKKEDMVGKYAVNRIKSISGTYRPLLIDFLNKPTEDLPSVYSEVKRTKDFISAELYLPKKKAHIWVKASPLYDHEGSFIGGIETIRDISKWRITEESLKKSKDLLAQELEVKIKDLVNENTRLTEELARHQEPLNTRILLERGLDVFRQKLLIIDYKGNIKYISDTMASHLNIGDKKEVVESNVFQMMDPPSSRSILQLLVNREGDSIELECSFSSGGKTVVIPVTVSLIQENGDISGFLIRDREGLPSLRKEEMVMADRLVKLGGDTP